MEKVKFKKYYVEFSHSEIEGEDGPYLLQSKWFDTQKEAIEWFRTNFDDVDSSITVDLMVGEFYNEDEYDIDFVKHIN